MDDLFGRLEDYKPKAQPANEGEADAPLVRKDRKCKTAIQILASSVIAQAAEAKKAAKDEESEKRAKEIEEILEEIETAAEEYDAKELKIWFEAAVEFGIPETQYAEAYALWINLQSSVWCNQELEKLSKKESDDMCDLLLVSNLSDQLEELGHKHDKHQVVMADEIRQVAERMMQKQAAALQTKAAGGRKKSMFEGSTRDKKIAEKCFTDLRHFSRLRDWNVWGGRGGRARLDKEGIPAMLRFSPEAIAEPLTMLDKTAEVSGVRMFTNLLRYMGDKPAGYCSDKLKPLLEGLHRTQDLCDEIYVQVIKQLTANPDPDSAEKGWELVYIYLEQRLPSAELSEFLRCFLQRTAAPVEQKVPGVNARGGVARRGAAGKVKFSFSDSESENSESDDESCFGGNYEKEKSAFMQRQPGLASEALELMLSWNE